MFEDLKRFFAPPHFEEPEVSRTAGLVNAIVVSILGLALVGSIFPALFSDPNELIPSLVIGMVSVGLLLGLKYLLNQGHLELVSILLIVVLFVLATATIFLFGGIRSANTAVYILLIIIASLLARKQASRIAILAGASILATLAMYLAEKIGLIKPQPSAEIVDWLIYTLLFIVSGLLLRFAMDSLTFALGRAERSEKALAEKNRELVALNEALEERVIARTRALEWSAEVSRRLSTILDREQLISEVVTQLQGAFDYYHVHIYLLDTNKRILHMAGGTGEPGRLMLQRNHSLERGQGIVGRAASTNLPILVPDVSKEPAWVPNSLLPETRSELAIPIALGQEVLGVLDVQHSVVGGLTEEDQRVTKSIVNQVAIALQNARLYRDAQRRAEREALLNTINQRIQSTVSVPQAMQVAVRELGRALNGRRTSVWLAELANGDAADE